MPDLQPRQDDERLLRSTLQGRIVARLCVGDIDHVADAHILGLQSRGQLAVERCALKVGFAPHDD